MKFHGSPAYRPDIDGLRAISVLAVVVYHYRASFPQFQLQGGFTGVDVFFVISGFLITQGLAQDIQTGTFSVLSFYDRRIKRILPALVFMLLRRTCPETSSHTSELAVASLQGPILRAFDDEATKYPRVSVYRSTDALCAGGKFCIDRVDGEFIFRENVHLRRNLPDAARGDLARILGLGDFFRYQ